MTTAKQDVLELLQEDPDFDVEGTTLQYIGAGAAIRIIRAFTEEFSQMASAWENNEYQDNEALTRFAHTIKGSAANIGAIRLADLAREVETQIKNNNGEGIGNLITELRNIINKLQKFNSA